MERVIALLFVVVTLAGCSSNIQNFDKGTILYKGLWGDTLQSVSNEDINQPKLNTFVDEADYTTFFLMKTKR